MHACKDKAAGPISRVQRVGAQAITGAFLTVATSVAEAEAHIATARQRFWKRAIKMWIDIHTLPFTNPLRDLTSRIRKFRRMHRSPFHQVADALSSTPLEELETIAPFTLAPWEERVETYGNDNEQTTPNLLTGWAVQLAVSSSGRNDIVGVGGAIQIPVSIRGGPRLETFSFTLGIRETQNPYSGELAAIAYALKHLPEFGYRSVAVLTSNKAAMLTLRQPRQQSGQAHVRGAYDSIESLKANGNTIAIIWLPANEENELLKTAKEEARKATLEGSIPRRKFARMRSTTLNIAQRKYKTDNKGLPENIGKYSKRLDVALPGKHTRQLYDHLSWKEASVLAQLRTGMARLNYYLYRIKVEPSEQCQCGQAKETVEHFLFRCIKWIAYRGEMLRCTDTRRGNLSFYLGGKSPSDNTKWQPNMAAVRATIRFAIATGRLDNR